jgi:hypothetical protein
VSEQTRHVCHPYRNVRGELIDPADQGGIGCPVCWPDDGRVIRLDRKKKEDPNADRA